LPPGQHLYLVARDDWADNWTDAEDDDSNEHVTVDTRAEHLARQEFINRGKVRLTENEQDANFIFLIVIDPDKATKQAVLAEVVTPDCYTESTLAHCDSKWRAWGETPLEVVQRFYKEVLP